MVYFSLSMRFFSIKHSDECVYSEKESLWIYSLKKHLYFEKKVRRRNSTIFSKKCMLGHMLEYKINKILNQNQNKFYRILSYSIINRYFDRKQKSFCSHVLINLIFHHFCVSTHLPTQFILRLIINMLL